MKKELFEDKLIKFEKENSLLGDIFKDNVTNFILTNWEGEEEELFGSRYELMRFVYDNYFRYFEEQIVSLDAMLQLIKDFKVKALENMLKHSKMPLEDAVEDIYRTMEAISPEKYEERINKMKQYIKGD